MLLMLDLPPPGAEDRFRTYRSVPAIVTAMPWGEGPRHRLLETIGGAAYCVFLTGSNVLAGYDGEPNAEQVSGPVQNLREPRGQDPRTHRPQGGVEKTGPQTREGCSASSATSLCNRCNHAGSQLHNNKNLLDLIDKGAPISQKTLEDLAEWVIWVLLLLCVETKKAEIIKTGRAHLIGQPAVTSASAWPIEPRGGPGVRRLVQRKGQRENRNELRRRVGERCTPCDRRAWEPRRRPLGRQDRSRCPGGRETRLACSRTDAEFGEHA